MSLAPNLTPFRRVAGIGHARITRDIFKHFGELQPIGERQKQGEDIRTPDYGHGLVACELKRMFDAVGLLRSYREPVAVASEDDMPPPWQEAW